MAEDGRAMVALVLRGTVLALCLALAPQPPASALGADSPSGLARLRAVRLIRLSEPLAPATPALHVIPFPGTPDASPLCQIIFSSLSPSEVSTVTAIGSISGMHPGHLSLLPDGAGTAFGPDHPFTVGEQVNVTATLSSPAAGTASGDPGATVLRFSFGVGVSAYKGAGDPGHAPTASRAHPTRHSPSRSTSGPIHRFHSQPRLNPPVVSVSSDADTASGDIFTTPTSHGQSGPMILDSRGRLVWFRPLDGYAANLAVQRYLGQPVLTWWQVTDGDIFTNHDVIVDRHYRTVAVLHGGYGYLPDMHEFQLTSRGTALIAEYSTVRADLTPVGGSSNGSVVDCVVQELDVRTNRVLWEWHALGHIPLSAAYVPGNGTPFDFCHLNSIQQLPDGNLLVSLRNTWAVYEINHLTGRVIWTLGGKGSNFRMGAGTNFEWQHDARLHPSGILTLFDDGSDGTAQEERQSSAKVLRLNLTRMTATVVRRYTHRPPLLASAEGSTQILPDGNVFVGWGEQPAFSEYTPGGKQIFTGTMPLGVVSYRAYRSVWYGSPLTRPAVTLAQQGNGRAVVYASWSGATGIAAWRVLGGSTPGALRSLARAKRHGFETGIALASQPRYVAVQALAASGKILRTSVTVSDPPS